MQRCADGARRLGYALTMFGRRRYLPAINSRNGAMRQFAERQAVNTPVQGAAADLIKLAMVRVHAMLGAEGFKARMVMTVHDELVFDAHREEVDALARRVRQLMSQAAALAVPVEVTVKVGENWSEMTKV
jgi:DNA polymerase-1